MNFSGIKKTAEIKSDYPTDDLEILARTRQAEKYPDKEKSLIMLGMVLNCSAYNSEKLEGIRFEDDVNKIEKSANNEMNLISDNMIKDLGADNYPLPADKIRCCR